jgi:hypothetical protein
MNTRFTLFTNSARDFGFTVEFHQIPVSTKGTMKEPVSLTRQLTTHHSLLEPDVAVLNHHGRPYMNLNAEEPIELSVYSIVVRDITHQYSIDKMLQPVSPGNDVTDIPVVGFDESAQRIPASK